MVRAWTLLSHVANPALGTPLREGLCFEQNQEAICPLVILPPGEFRFARGIFFWSIGGRFFKPKQETPVLIWIV